MRVRQSWRRCSHAASAAREGEMTGNLLGGLLRHRSTAQASDLTAMPSVAHVSGPERVMTAPSPRSCR